MSIHTRFTSPSSPSPRRRSIPRRSPASMLCLEALEGRRLLTTFTVENVLDAGPGSLREAILAANAAPGPDRIRFDAAARDGTITLASGQLTITDDLIIDGPGAARLAVSGNDASRVFQIGSGVTASIDDLTITHGRAVGQGGGILNAGGTLTLSHAVLSDNQVVGLPGATPGAVVDAFGGGIFNSGSLAVSHSAFVNNRCIGGDGTPTSIGSSGLGGAIMSGGTAIAPATANVSYSTFLDNQAKGGAAGIGASRAGVGGAVNNTAGTFTVSFSLFHGNQAVGGTENGVPGGFGAGVGGAISNVARPGSAILSVSHCTLTDNRAVGGAAGAGAVAQNGRGGAIANYVFGGVVPPVTVAAIAHVDRSTILGNQAVGGAGPTGGNGLGGSIENENGGVLAVSDSLIALNRAVGGAGTVNGGNGLGGGVFTGGPNTTGTPTLTLDRSLVVLNRADGGAAGVGVAGLGLGGGVYIAPGGIAGGDRTTVLANDASTSDDDVYGVLL